MHLKKISIINYKNFETSNFEFDSKINCFVGRNGVGKSNALDAIYHLCNTKGYFNTVSSQNIKHDTDFFVIDGVFNHDNRDDQVHCSLKRGGKKTVKFNGKIYDKLSDHIGKFPIVIISPADTNLISEGSDMRRKFMDGIIALSDKDYLSSLINYNKILSQRNSLLKYFAANHTFDQDNIEVYNLQLIQYGETLFEKRKEFITNFIPVFEKRYTHLVNNYDKNLNIEEVTIDYKSKLLKTDFKNLLNENLSKDRLLQYTSVGLHKDDLMFKINGYPIKKIGSQGQQKTFLIALKLAQFDIIKQQTKVKPILLLDDVFDKLDENRVAQLIDIVNDDNFGQLFISDTHAERTEKLIQETKQTYSMFEL